MSARFVFCESCTAPSLASWHIRELAEGEEPRYGGNVKGRVALCGRDFRINGWDIEVDVRSFMSRPRVRERRRQDNGKPVVCSGCHDEYDKRQSDG